MIKDFKKLINHPKLKQDTQKKLKLFYRADEEVAKKEREQFKEDMREEGMQLREPVNEMESAFGNPIMESTDHVMYEDTINDQNNAYQQYQSSSPSVAEFSPPRDEGSKKEDQKMNAEREEDSEEESDESDDSDSSDSTDSQANLVFSPMVLPQHIIDKL